MLDRLLLWDGSFLKSAACRRPVRKGSALRSIGTIKKKREAQLARLIIRRRPGEASLTALCGGKPRLTCNHFNGHFASESNALLIPA